MLIIKVLLNIKKIKTKMIPKFSKLKMLNNKSQLSSKRKLLVQIHNIIELINNLKL